MKLIQHTRLLSLLFTAASFLVSPSVSAQTYAQDIGPQARFSITPSVFVNLSSLFSPSIGATNIEKSVYYGAEAKIGVSNEISIRPLAAFSSNGSLYGAALTYDFNVTQRTREAHSETYDDNQTVQIAPGIFQTQNLGTYTRNYGPSTWTNAPFVGVGALVNNKSGSTESTGLKPFLVLGASPVEGLGINVKYILGDSIFLANVGYNINF